MNLRNIYQPIWKSLSEVEKRLKEEVMSDFDIFGISDPQTKYTLERFVGGGKRLRPALFLFSAHSFGGDCNQEAITVATAFELIHIASLIHDDIVDDTTSRRDCPSVHTILGTKSAVMYGDYLLGKALRMVESVNLPKILSMCVETVQEMCAGQLMEFHLLKNERLNEEGYLDVIKKKTASLFALSCQAGGIIRNASKIEQTVLFGFGLNLGIIYQVRDDIEDASSPVLDVKFISILSKTAEDSLSKITHPVEKKGLKEILYYISQPRIENTSHQNTGGFSPDIGGIPQYSKIDLKFQRFSRHKFCIYY